MIELFISAIPDPLMVTMSKDSLSDVIPVTQFSEISKSPVMVDKVTSGMYFMSE